MSIALPGTLDAYACLITALAFRIAIDQRWVVGERGIAFDNFSTNRSVDIACGLYRLDDCGVIALGDSSSGFGHLSEDDIAERFLGMIGNADSRDVAFDADPFMLLGEIEAHATAPCLR